MCRKHFTPLAGAHTAIVAAAAALITAVASRRFPTVLLFRSFSFRFFPRILFFICFHLCRLASYRFEWSGMRALRRCVCASAIIDINAKHQKVFQFYRSNACWLLPSPRRVVVLNFGDGSKCLNILRYHGAMERN